MKGNIQFYHGRGKLGNSVGYTLYGQQMFRAYVGKGEIVNPKSAAQMLQRAKIKALTATSIIFRAAAVLGFKDEARSRGCSAVNFFVHENYPMVTGTTPETVIIDPSRISCSRGNVPGVVFSSSFGTSTPGTLAVTVTYGNEHAEGASTDDNVYVILFCPDAGTSTLSAPARRSDGATLNIRYPESWSGLEVHAYGFVVNEDGKSSNSEYIGHAELG